MSGGQNMQERHFLNYFRHTYHGILVIDMLFLYLLWYIFRLSCVKKKKKINIVYPGANGPNESPAADSVCSPVADLLHAVHKLFQIQSWILRTADLQRLGNICHSALWGSACLLLGLFGNAVPYARLLIPCRWRHEDHMRQEIESHLLLEGFFGGSEVDGWKSSMDIWLSGGGIAFPLH